MLKNQNSLPKLGLAARLFAWLPVFLLIVTLTAAPSAWGQGAPDPSAAPAEVNLTYLQACWLCEPLKAFVAVAADLSVKLFDALRDDVMALFVWLFALMVLLKLIRVFSPLAFMENVQEEFVKLGKKFVVLCVITAIMYGAADAPAHNGYNFYDDWIQTPIMNAAFGLSNLVFELGADSIGEIAIPGFTYDQAIVLSNDNDARTDCLGILLEEKLSCMTAQLQHAMSGGIALGVTMMTGALNLVAGTNFFTILMTFASGLLLVLVYGFVIVLLPLTIIGVVVKISVVSLLSVLLIPAYIFDYMKNIPIKAFKMILLSALTMVILTMVVVVGIGVTNLAAVLAGKSLLPYDTTITNLQSLLDAMSQSTGGTATIGITVSFADTGYWTILLAGVMIGWMQTKANDIAANLLDVGDPTDKGSAFADQLFALKANQIISRYNPYTVLTKDAFGAGRSSYGFVRGRIKAMNDKIDADDTKKTAAAQHEALITAIGRGNQRENGKAKAS